MGTQTDPRAGHGPSPAERARTAVAQARVGTLVIRGCRRTPRTMTVVGMHDRGGMPEVGLEIASAAGQRAVHRPVVALYVTGPDGFAAVRLVGRLVTVDDGATTGSGRFRLTAAGVALVDPGVHPVPVADYLGAAPDPLRREAGRILAHLDAAHAEDLAACVRAHGHEALAVVPRGIDRYGIELAVIEEYGVSRVRLAFPGGPVSSIRDLAPAVRLPLTCCCRQHDR